jgi:outer membrane protein TolC
MAALLALVGPLELTQAQAPAKILQAPTAEAPALTLEECVQLGLQYQPALQAARASLEAAQASARGLQNLGLAACLAKDIAQRRAQSCLGVVIAQSSLLQAEWETRYAVTRLYFAAIYARSQEEVLKSVIVKLDVNRGVAAEIVKARDPTSKITENDVKNLDVQIAFYKSRAVEATIGIQRAHAALREAIGVDRGFPLQIPRNARLPALVSDIDMEEMIALALAQRGEMVRVSSAQQVTALEVEAQGLHHHDIKVQTFAAGGDIHAHPIPQGVSNHEYRPGAIGLEMPAFLIGKRPERVQRARAFYERAGAVVSKTQNLITLEVEAAYYKWKEALDRAGILSKTTDLARQVADSTNSRFLDKKATGEELVRAITLKDQSDAQYNEALYNHALALAMLERVTAGGYRPTYAAAKP